MIRAALFDMDRTLLSRESASLYVRYQRRIGEATTRDLLRTLGWVAQYTLGILDHMAVATKVLRTLEGQAEAAMIERCEKWFASDVEQYITEGGRRAVASHLAAGDVCAIVTGASLYASRPLAHRLAIPHVVATEFEVDAGGLFTGRARDPLCIGEGKLARALAFVKERGLALEEATFYTDSITDLPLLERVREPIVVNPDPRLARVARQRGWTILRW